MHYTLLVVITVVVSLVLIRVVRFFMQRYIRKSSEHLRVDPTNYQFFSNAVSFLIFLGAIIYIFNSIPALKDIGVSLFAGAGILAAIIGFASQKAFSNIISGIFIVIFKPFRVGDLITVGSDEGFVEDITLRHTIIKNFQNRRIIIPNANMSEQTIINSTISDPKIRNHFEIGISYDSDIDLAMKIIREEAEKHPATLDLRTAEEKADGEPIVDVRVIGTNDFSIDLKAWIWTSEHVGGFLMCADIRKSIKERFDREGVEIPFPYRTIVYKSDLPANAKKA